MKSKDQIVELIQDEVTAVVAKVIKGAEVDNSTSLEKQLLAIELRKAEEFAASVNHLMSLFSTLFTCDRDIAAFKKHIEPLLELAPAQYEREVKLKYVIQAGLTPKGLSPEKTLDQLDIAASTIEKVKEIAAALVNVRELKKYAIEFYWAGGKAGWHVTAELIEKIESKFTKTLAPAQVELLASVAIAEVAFQKIADLIHSGSLPQDYLFKGNHTNSSLFKRVTDILSRKLATMDFVNKVPITSPDNCPTLVTDVDTL